MPIISFNLTLSRPPFLSLRWEWCLFGFCRRPQRSPLRRSRRTTLRMLRKVRWWSARQLEIHSWNIKIYNIIMISPQIRVCWLKCASATSGTRAKSLPSRWLNRVFAGGWSLTTCLGPPLKTDGKRPAALHSGRIVVALPDNYDPILVCFVKGVEGKRWCPVDAAAISDLSDTWHSTRDREESGPHGARHDATGNQSRGDRQSRHHVEVGSVLCKSWQRKLYNTGVFTEQFVFPGQCCVTFSLPLFEFQRTMLTAWRLRSSWPSLWWDQESMVQ